MSNKINQDIESGATGNTVIGEQNIYGLTPEQASKLALDLFMDNFPKLKEEALQVVTQRMETFCENLVNKIVCKNGGDFSEFAYPDMQYILVKAETDYARFGTDELLDTLTDLVCKRVQSEQSSVMKMILDKAIETVSYLSAEQLDFLSIIFYSKHVRFNLVGDKVARLKSLKDKLINIANAFSKADINSLNFLQSNNCLQLNLGESVEIIAEAHEFEKNEVRNILPEIFKNVPSDYGLTLVGKALAIANIEKKLYTKLDMSIWIK